MEISGRYDWSGHNFPSEGYRRDSGSSVTWFRMINGKPFQFTAWMNRRHVVTYVHCLSPDGRIAHGQSFR